LKTDLFPLNLMLSKKNTTKREMFNTILPTNGTCPVSPASERESVAKALYGLIGIAVFVTA
jgi:hypothetical protein